MAYAKAENTQTLAPAVYVNFGLKRSPTSSFFILLPPLELILLPGNLKVENVPTENAWSFSASQYLQPVQRPSLTKQGVMHVKFSEILVKPQLFCQESFPCDSWSFRTRSSFSFPRRHTLNRRQLVKLLPDSLAILSSQQGPPFSGNFELFRVCHSATPSTRKTCLFALFAVLGHVQDL